MHQTLSVKPSPMRRGPSMGTVRLLTVRLALNQRVSMERVDCGRREQGGTRSKPWTSKVERWALRRVRKGLVVEVSEGV